MRGGSKSTHSHNGLLWLVKACCVIFLVHFIVILFFWERYEIYISNGGGEDKKQG